MIVGLVALISLSSFVSAECGTANATYGLNCWDAEDDSATVNATDQWETQYSINFTASGNVHINTTESLSYNTTGNGGNYYCYSGGYQESPTQPYVANIFNSTGTVSWWFKPIDDYTTKQTMWGIPNGQPRVYFGDTNGDVSVFSWDGDTTTITATPMNKGDNEWVHAAFSWNSNTQDIYIFINGTNVTGTATFGGAGQGAFTKYLFETYLPPTWKPAFGNIPFDLNEPFKGCLDEIMWFNGSLSAQDINNLYNYGRIEGASGSVSSGSILVNITYPNASQKINRHLWVNATTNMSCSSCSINDSRWDLQSFNASNTSWSFQNNSALSDGTYSVNISCTNQSETNGSSIRTFIIDATSPTITVNSDSSFSTTYSKILNVSQASAFFINLTIGDNLDLYALEINITNETGYQVYNMTNVSLSGTQFNWTKSLDLSTNVSGNYTINITAYDSHTAQVIPELDVKKGLNYLEFESKIRVSADAAWSSKANKLRDRYSFEFSYPPLVVPSTKVFYVESDDSLQYIPDSTFTAHFVDFDNKIWIDFEGLSNSPKITKINDKKYKIEFTNADDKVVFNSIGLLNEYTINYDFYLHNDAPLMSFIRPPPDLISTNGTFFTVLNVTDTYRNTTEFTVYNTSGHFPYNVSVTYQGSGSYQYNYTFVGLTSQSYTINATHTDQYNQSNTTTATIYNTFIDNCTFYSTKALNFTVRDEGNNSLIKADITGTFNYSSDGITYSTFSVDYKDIFNFSICIYPNNATFIGDYSLYYSDTNYPQRRYYDDSVTMNNVTEEVNLYMLYVSDGIYVRFQVVDQFSNVIEGVTSNMKNDVGGTWVTVEQEETDGSGLATFWVNPDEDYQFTFTKTGYQSYTTTLRPTTSEIYTVTLQEEGDVSEYSYATEVDFMFTPLDNILNLNNSYLFTFNLTSTYWDITWCGFWVKNGTTNLNQSNSSYSSRYCNVSIGFNISGYDSISTQAIYEINGSANVTQNMYYSSINTYKGTFSLMNFIDDLTAFGDAGFNNFTRLFIAFIVIFAITASIAKTASIYDPEALILVVCGLVLFFSYIGWMRVGYSGIPFEWLKDWIIFIVILLAGAAYIMKREFT